MSKLKSAAISTEVKCSACDGTGYPAVAQPTQPGRRIYPPPNCVPARVESLLDRPVFPRRFVR
jgi:hypothetical protein